MPLLILFWDAKKIGLAFILVAFGNIFECFGFSVVVAVVLRCTGNSGHYHLFFF